MYVQSNRFFRVLYHDMILLLFSTNTLQGKETMKTIRNAKVLVIGAGGIGMSSRIRMI